MSQGPWQATFALLVQQHLSQAVWFCREHQKKPEHLELAQLEISLLEVLQEKTRGNLTAEEEQLLAEALHEARMTYVWAKQKKPESVEEKTEKNVPEKSHAGENCSSHSE